jgi:hypothetical protein
MEYAVPERVQFKVFDRIDWLPGADHMVPLEKLMENDSIEEASKTQAEQQAGG